MHGPNQNNARFFSRLGTLLGELASLHQLIILGDFNSQLANVGLTEEEKQLIGTSVGHNSFNENGSQMRFFLGLHSLVARNTKAPSYFKVTWKSGDRHSQIDHILTHTHSKLYLKALRCIWPNLSTDHKMLLCNVVKNRAEVPGNPNRKRPFQPRADLDPTLLRYEPIQKKFKEQITSSAPSSYPDGRSVEESWGSMKTRLEDAAIATLKRRRVLNRCCRLAQAHLKKCQFWANRSYNPKWKYRLDEAKEDLRRKIRESEEEEMKLGLSDIETRRFGERLRLSHKLFKRFKKVPDKKSKSSTTASSIKLGDWLVGDSGPNLIPPLQPDLDCPPLLSPPTLEEVRSILDQMKNGKTPGADNLCSEYLKYGGEQALGELHQLLTKVWIENCMPADWKHVVVVPIPKVKNPKTTDHYRKISLTSCAYKVYATWVLGKLQQLVGPIGSHQAAFLPNRSTTDHLFILQRLLQERWNGGKSTLLMSLDIEKAFDRVCLLSLPAILRRNTNTYNFIQNTNMFPFVGKGVPNNFINRVIECLKGEQQFLWQRQLSETQTRHRGIKQGCPG